jgi:stearoyl-CoA desaturase (delta-9 desaturase)
MLVFGIIGNGIAGHRLIAHRQFKPANWVKAVLYLICTLAAFAPVWYWRAQHWHHHKYADEPVDVHSPHTRSLWDSFFGWALMQKYVRLVLKTERASLKESLEDPQLKFYVDHSYRVVWAFVLLSLLISPSFLLAYLIYYWIEIVRLGTITSLAHLDIPFSYRNFETEDQSRNNLLLGYLTFGFGWHNNHHAKPMLLDTQIRWWEFDLEAKIAKLINLIPGKRS